MAFRLIQPSGSLKALEWMRVSNQEGYVLESVQLGDSPRVCAPQGGRHRGSRAQHGLRVLQIMRKDRTLGSRRNCRHRDSARADSILVMTRREDFTKFCAKV